MKPKTHTLKAWPQFFVAMQKGLKLFDIRKNDRQFKVGDTLVMREWIPLTGYIGAAQGDFTGRKLKFRVVFIMEGSTDIDCTTKLNSWSWGLVKGYVCMQLKRIR